jgi:hypothetical protein
MRQGHFDAAWRISDLLLNLRGGRTDHTLPRHYQSIWDGTPLAGRHVLIRCYHGLGDTIQFARYLPMVNRIARSITVWAQPQLLSLLQTMSPPPGNLLPLHDGCCDCSADVDVEIMELPYVFRTNLRTIPSHVPYFHVGRSVLSSNSKPDIGLIWQAGDWDPRRSIPFSLIRELACNTDINWRILQRGPGLAEWDGSFGLNSGSDDVLGAARVIASLDLVITIDSMPAHLAGALGAPVWTLLPYEADWRWMENRDNSPWYPTMRLFRQVQPGDWASVIETVTTELRRRFPQLS